mgnify:CR=1 FL=1
MNPRRWNLYIEKEDVVNEELAGLADRVLNGEITERIAGKTETLTADEPAQAAFYATHRTRIYEEEPAAVLSYTQFIPNEWEEYHEAGDLDEVQAMAKASFEHELYEYLTNYTEDNEGDNR